MSHLAPSPRERELAASAVFVDNDGLALMLAAHREEVLREFVELQLDCEAMGDVKLARALRDIIDTARGVP